MPDEEFKHRGGAGHELVKVGVLRGERGGRHACLSTFVLIITTREDYLKLSIRGLAEFLLNLNSYFSVQIAVLPNSSIFNLNWIDK